MAEANHSTRGTKGTSLPDFTYQGTRIHERGEMLSLTDMWKAAGSDESRRPDDWKKSSANRAFIEHIAMTANAPLEGIWKGTRGAGGRTWAHWQIGLAYAKYLSSELHAWCNQVVRTHMEGEKPVDALTVRPASIDAREARLYFAHCLRIAKLLKLEGTQALMAANNATKELIGIDMLGVMGITHVTAPQNEQLLNVTCLGERLGNVSARDTNAYLCRFGYQEAFRDQRGKVYYEPTALGREAGGVLQDTGKKNSAGVPIRQLRWASGVVKRLREDIDRPTTLHS